MNAKIFFETKLRELSQCKIVLDTGGATPFQKDLAPYKEWFKNCDFRTLDVNADYHPDIVGDIHDMPIENESIDGVLCKAVLEHVQNPLQACQEIHRILKPGGRALFWVPFIYSYHCDRGFYKDYWRFTEDSVCYMLRDFSEVEVVKSKHYFEAILALLPIPRFLQSTFFSLGRLLDRIFHVKNQAGGFYAFAKK